MSDTHVYPVPANFADAHISRADYAAMYERSVHERDAFFGEMAARFLTWDKPWDEVSASIVSTGTCPNAPSRSP